MKKTIFLIVLVAYIAGPLLYFIAKTSLDYGFGFTFVEEYIGTFETIQTYFLSTIAGMGALLIFYAFYEDGISKYSLSNIAGIIGICATLLSLSVIRFAPVFVWVLLVSGILCLYSISVPIISSIYKKMDGNDWEKGAVTATLGFFLLYWLGYKSDIVINTIFLVDPKHFSYSKFIAGLVVLSPYIFAASFGFILYFSFKAFTAKKGSCNKSFFTLNGMFSSIVLFIFSFTLWGGGNVVIKNTASVVDFNPYSICSNITNKEGVIYLDPKYHLVLVNGKDEENHHTYTVTHCDAGI